MTCPDGDTERVTGAATPSADGGRLKIEWGSGASETYDRSTNSTLPTAIPTGLGLPAS
jgi:hypothetical protein